VARADLRAPPSPEDAREADGVTLLSCPVEEAVRVALHAAGGKNVEVFSPTIGRQLLETGLIDEIRTRRIL
jgi:altronate dehydratase